MIKETYAEIKRIADAEDLLRQAVLIRTTLFTALESMEYAESREEGLKLGYLGIDALDEHISALRAREEWESRENHLRAIAELLEVPKENRQEWDAETLKKKGIVEDGRSVKEIMDEYEDKVRSEGIVITY